ncbi:MAG: tetratricopeptide repeat protein [Treponema sp.]|jgi:tetratricopeptide (TPR) repeat protein|nr:tetratricopeptide repeat protein [Treponema sp.]
MISFFFFTTNKHELNEHALQNHCLKSKKYMKSPGFLRGSWLIIFLFLIYPFNLFAQQGSPAMSAAAYYERGRNFMAQENWYSAVESFLECVRLNPAHAEGTAALGECYYELAEFDQALNWVRKARLLARTNMSIANLEVFTLIALGRLDAASALVSEILAREPYNRETLFAAGELDIATNRTSDAMLRYREAVRRYPDDRRLLISLALVSHSLGDGDMSIQYINSALDRHPDDYRVFYYAAYIYAMNDRLSEAIGYAQLSLSYKSNHVPSQELLATLRYRNSQYEEAIRLADSAIAHNRQNMSPWYLKGLSLTRMNRQEEAIAILATAVYINENDEFIRAILEDALISSTAIEDPRRARFASWHFEKARGFRSRNLMDQALFEYRRGLRLNPFAADRREYADILRLSGYPARYLEELRFLQDQGKTDRSLTDAVEAYNSLLSNALFRQWQVNPVDLSERHWKIAVFSLSGQSSYYHADAGITAASIIRELLVHDRNIAPMNLELRQASFSQGFRQAREAGADYFMFISVTENERDISIKGELFTGRTGAPAGTFNTYRTGSDRLRGASRGIIDQLSSSLPLRGRLIIRKQGQALINKGKADGITAGAVFDVVKKDRLSIANEGISLLYNADELVGKITIDNVDEEIASGALTRNGFFDRIEPGDEIILQSDEKKKPVIESAANPELRALLRTLR